MLLEIPRFFINPLNDEKLTFARVLQYSDKARLHLVREWIINDGFIIENGRKNVILPPGYYSLFDKNGLRLYDFEQFRQIGGRNIISEINRAINKIDDIITKPAPYIIQMPKPEPITGRIDSIDGNTPYFNEEANFGINFTESGTPSKPIAHEPAGYNMSVEWTANNVNIESTNLLINRIIGKINIDGSINNEIIIGRFFIINPRDPAYDIIITKNSICGFSDYGLRFENIILRPVFDYQTGYGTDYRAGVMFINYEPVGSNNRKVYRQTLSGVADGNFFEILPYEDYYYEMPYLKWMDSADRNLIPPRFNKRARFFKKNISEIYWGGYVL